jgi:hypothetical protein
MKVSGASPKALDIAEHLIAYEAVVKSTSETDRPAAFQVCEKLRHPLSTLTGAAGFRSLLVRALTLAKREASVLDVVRVKDDGSLEGLTCGVTEPGGALLIGKLLDLLITFIGEALTMRLLLEIWPGLAGVGVDSGERKLHD